MAVRATWKPVELPPLIPQLNARMADGRYYAARVANGNVYLSERRQSDGTTSTRPIQQWPLPVGIDEKAEHTLELRAVGDLLAVRWGRNSRLPSTAKLWSRRRTTRLWPDTATSGATTARRRRFIAWNFSISMRRSDPALA